MADNDEELRRETEKKLKLLREENKAREQQLKNLKNNNTAVSGSTVNLNGLSSAGRTAASALMDIGRYTKDLIPTWRRLSSGGSNFSNDVTTMSHAAAQTRMELTDFVDVIEKSNKNLAGLGGSVSRGSESFAQLSNEMFKNEEQISSLRNLGYTAKDLNEILSDQISVTRYRSNVDAKSSADTVKSSMAYAKELDTLTKLTGRNRQELTEQMQSRAMQSRVESRFKLMEQEVGKDAADAARQNFKTMMAQAESMGMGTMAMEAFLKKGAITSETSAYQYALGGQAAEDMMRSMVQLSSGMTEEAKVSIERAKVQNAINQNNPMTDTLNVFMDDLGSVGAVLNDYKSNNMALSDAIQKTADSTGVLLNSQEAYAKTLMKINEDLEKSQTGQFKKPSGEYEQRGNVNKVLLDLEQQGYEVKAEAMRRFVEVELAKGLSAAQMTQKGAGVVNDLDLSGYREKLFEATDDLVEIVGNGLGKLSEMNVKDVKNFVLNGVMPEFKPEIPTAAATTPTPEKPVVEINAQSREKGSMGMVGKVVEDFGKGTLVMAHGREGIYTENQLMDLMKGIRSSAIGDSMTQLNNSIIKTGTEVTMPEFDFSMFKDFGKNIFPQLEKMIEPSYNQFDEAIKNIFPQLEKMIEPSSKQFDDAIKTNFPEIKPQISAPIKNEINQIDLQSLKLNADGTPKQQSNDTNEQQQTKTETKTEQPTNTVANQTTTSQNEIIGQLKLLNSQIAELINQHADIGKRQVRAIRSNNDNIFQQ